VLKRLNLLLLIFIGLLSGQLGASEPSASVHVIISTDSRAYQNFSAGLLTQLDNNYHINTSTLNPRTKTLPTFDTTDIYVAIGTLATERLFKLKPKQPILSIFVTAGAWQKLATEYFGSPQLATQQGAQAIVINQPVQRYAALCQLLIPELRSISTAIGPSNWPLLSHYQQTKNNRSPPIHFAQLTPETNPLEAIEKVMSTSDLFLALPDQGIYTRSTAKWALYLAYRQRKPVVGFSEKYLNAGAVASLYSTPENIARQAQEWITEMLAGRLNNNNFSYPLYYTVGTNPRMANTLGIRIAKDLAQQLHREDISLRADTINTVEAKPHER
jgi:ABC-type uncharacterized transport system substrate-binding protein